MPWPDHHQESSTGPWSCHRTPCSPSSPRSSSRTSSSSSSPSSGRRSRSAGTATRCRAGSPAASRRIDDVGATRSCRARSPRLPPRRRPRVLRGRCARVRRTGPECGPDGRRRRRRDDRRAHRAAERQRLVPDRRRRGGPDPALPPARHGRRDRARGARPARLAPGPGLGRPDRARRRATRSAAAPARPITSPASATGRFAVLHARDRRDPRDQLRRARPQGVRPVARVRRGRRSGSPSAGPARPATARSSTPRRSPPTGCTSSSAAPRARPTPAVRATARRPGPARQRRHGAGLRQLVRRRAARRRRTGCPVRDVDDARPRPAGRTGAERATWWRGEAREAPARPLDLLGRHLGPDEAFALGHRGRGTGDDLAACAARERQRHDGTHGHDGRARPRRPARARRRTSIGVAYEPLAEKTLASTATPNTPPISRMVFVAPDAWPSSIRSTDDRTTLAIGAKNRPIPMPASTNPGTSTGYATVGVVTAAIQARPAASATMPATRIGRPPMRPASTPAIGATMAGIAVHGSVRRPDWNGLRPWTIWKNWTRRNTAPKTPKYIRNETTLAAREAAAAEEAQRQHRRRGARLPGDEQRP